MYYLTVAAHPKDYDSYESVYDSQSYVGVGLSNTSVVGYVDPQSPANGKLRVGDVIESVVGSTLPAKDTTYLNGPKVVEEVALYQPGQVIELNVLRDGQPMTVTLKLAQWPIDQSSDYITTSTGNYDLM
jgi:S1-C subfamily serine protease